ncbi:unnamed protein product [Euphydryas editha]|uniref:phytanoyl-CoA dioxygenase n=1 Tax=Euphydryas editha TaxID=104508 RepID=A0AAU9UFU4_EUPED|nr:unnamed protein product [Euphydryas editha]
MTELSNTYIVSDEQRRFYDENGYLVIKGLLDFATLYNYKQRFLQICKGTVDKGNITVVKEISLKDKGVTGENLINKLQEIHYDDVFMTYTEHPRVLEVVSQFIGQDLRVMNSMFINKPPGSVSHPPHQDLYYFPFRPVEKIIAAWTAIDDVTIENGCLYVIPKSHKQGILYPHAILTGASRLYHGVQHAAPEDARVHLEMSPGDTVFFHPLLVHGSGANVSKRHRKCVTAHYASERCAYVSVRGTVQEHIAREVEAEAGRRGFELSFEDTWKIKSKSITLPSKL